jgi:uncharacterized protein YndB with AHSA1/START domain
MGTETDRIEKKIVLRAPRARVWRALSDSREFGSWFGVALDGPFVAGKRITGKIAPTTVDATIAAKQEPYAGMPFEAWVEKIEPERLFSFRWHPFGIDPKVDYSKEPTTLVELAIEDADGGTLLTVTETGFDGIPLARRKQAFGANEAGWTMQMSLVEKYVRQTS